MKTKKLLYILPLVTLVACEPELDDVSFTNGSADFSKTIAVGNSLTAGFQSGALDAQGQMNSLPAIIAEQMKTVGGGEFNQPILPGELGERGAGFDLSLAATGRVNTRFALKGTVNCNGEQSVGPVRLGEPYLGLPALIDDVTLVGPYNNQGVPGAKLTDLNDPTYANPYFVRMRTLGQTMLSLATSFDATFFTMWIGNNDVLGYATSGGDEGGDALTTSGDFQAQYSAAVSALTANGAKGVVANIPNVTSIPFFTTVPIGTDAVTDEQASLLNSAAAYGGYNAGLDQLVGMFPGFTQEEADRRKITFTGGQLNTFVVMDPSLTDLTSVNPALRSMRQARPGELMTLTLPGDSLLCAGWGTQTPIPGQFHLTTAEIQKINDATASYNSTIRSTADANGLAFFDANARLRELATVGIIEDGISFSSALVTGGAFSLDGVHPSTRGYAIIANDFIDAINSKYSSNIPKVNVSSYSTIEVEQ